MLEQVPLSRLSSLDLNLFAVVFEEALEYMLVLSCTVDFLVDKRQDGCQFKVADGKLTSNS